MQCKKAKFISFTLVYSYNSFNAILTFQVFFFVAGSQFEMIFHFSLLINYPTYIYLRSEYNSEYNTRY